MTNTFLNTPVDAVVFDCDGTLTKMEGINYLAKNSPHLHEIEALTETAMSDGGLNAELVEKRLNMIKPTLENVNALSKIYFQERVNGIDETIDSLKSINKPIYIISGGLQQCVEGFAVMLGIPPENAYGVSLSFDTKGEYQDFDRNSPLVTNNGKVEIIRIIEKTHPKIAFVGDGSNDLCCVPIVKRFVGFGGVYFREFIKNQCDYYITDDDIQSVLSYILTENEYSRIK